MECRDGDKESRGDVDSRFGDDSQISAEWGKQELTTQQHSGADGATNIRPSAARGHTLDDADDARARSIPHVEVRVPVVKGQSFGARKPSLELPTVDAPTLDAQALSKHEAALGKLHLQTLRKDVAQANAAEADAVQADAAFLSIAMACGDDGRVFPI